MNPAKQTAFVVTALMLVGAGAWLWRQGLAPAPPPPLHAAADLAEPTPTAPDVTYPIDGLAGADAGEKPLEVAALLSELLGRNTAQAMVQLQDFPRRFVATVDSLGRSHSSPALWPVVPAVGRFIVEARQGNDQISAENELRYAPYLLLIETVDMRQVFALYLRLYPLLQTAYEELGYPKRPFNDRLVEVIDQLLATPQVDAPLNVHLPAINGPVQPARPWVLYEFDDPALQSLSAGQKLLLRIGPINGQSMRANLAEFRQLATAAGAPR